MDWKNHLEKYLIQRIEKRVKIKVKLPHVNKKPLARKRILVQTPFSHFILKIEQTISRRKTTCSFAPFPVSAWLKSLLQFDFKNHENVWTDLKKNIAGQVLTYNSKNFHWLNRKLDQERTMDGLGKPIRKSDPKNRENCKNQSEIAACEQKTTSEKANFGSNTVFSLYFKIIEKKIQAAKPLAFSLHFLFRRD